MRDARVAKDATARPPTRPPEASGVREAPGRRRERVPPTVAPAQAGENVKKGSDDFVGMTLSDFASSRATTTRAARDEYARLMRTGVGLNLPTPTRCDHEDSVVKFCLPVAAEPNALPLETESVIIPMDSYRASSWNTLCLSSQVGCRMGCTFCETARLGLLRNLSAAEIVTQFLVARALVSEPGAMRWQSYRYRLSGIQNIVFMGMGEPLDNFDAVVQAIRVLSDPNGLAFPHKQITISTVGRIDGIRKLAELNWPNLRLAISLSAPNDALRDQLVPINKAMPLAELRRAVLEYPIARRGLFLIEYVLIKDVNDRAEHARQIAAWCRDLRCVVNLIPYNPQRDPQYATPSEATVLRFMHDLRDLGIFVKRRLPRGRDLMGACGQLGNPSYSRDASLSHPRACGDPAISSVVRR